MISRLLEYLREALGNVRRNRMRSVLTMLGMIIGTGSVIAVFGISRASASGIAATLTSFGEPAVFLQVDPQEVYPERAAVQYRDVAKVRAATAGLIDVVSPNYTRTFRVRAGATTGFDQVASVDGYAAGDTTEMQEGRKIGEDDVAAAAHVCMLTPDIAEKYFGGAPAVGNVLTIGGTRFRVIGVRKPLSGSVFNSLAGTGTISIPYSAFHQMQPGSVDYLLFYPHDPKRADAAAAAVVQALQRLHGPRALYFTQNAQDALLAFQNVLLVITVGLSAIGAIALLVAGIGTMNIMLVSVAERRREIGLRRAVGASRRDIALQFLIESLVISLLGGGTGLGFGLLVTALAAQAIAQQLGAAIVPYVLLCALAGLFSLVIGLAFGMYPAVRAARLDPIEGLRS